MSTISNQDYSAYYKGEQDYKKYSPNRPDKKEVSAKHGAKKGAAPHHGRDVVEFSRDGMEALEESKKDAAENARNQKANKQTALVDESSLSQRAQDLLKKLRETYGNMDFFVGDPNKVSNKDIFSRSTKEFAVIISSEELEKMAADEEYAAKCMEKIESAVSMAERIHQELADGENANGMRLNKLVISFNEDGTTSFFAELIKSGEKQRERIEEAREERHAEKKEQEKRAEHEKQKERIRIRADSIEELLEEIRNR